MTGLPLYLYTNIDVLQTSIHIGLTQWMSEKRDAYYLKPQSCWVLQGGDDWSGTATSCEDRVSLKLSCCQPPAEQQAIEAQCELQGEAKTTWSCTMISFLKSLFVHEGCLLLRFSAVLSSFELKSLQHPEVSFVTKKSIALLLVVKSKYRD